MSNEQTIEVETLEIADLEYEVGGMGALELSDGQMAHEGFIVTNLFPPR